MALLAPHQQQLPVGRDSDNAVRMPAPILLNSAAAKQYAFSLSHQQQRHHVGSSASSTMSSSDASTSNGNTNQTERLHPSGRRILVKWAPLPDPRQLEIDEADNMSVTSESEEQLYDDLRKTNGNNAGLLRVASLSSSVGDLNAGGGGASPGAGDSPRSSPRWSTKRLLRPLLPKGSGGADGSMYDGGESSLYRASSRDSIHSTHSSASTTAGGMASSLVSLATFKLGSKHRSASDLEHHQRARSSSTASSSSALFSRMTPLTHTTSESAAISSPLGRTTSNGSVGGGGAIRRTRSQSANAATGANNKKRFMLNGRVYGSRRGALTPDPFSHQRAHEPEFVEWGSGGLGAVPTSRAQGAAADWNRVTAGGTTFSGKGGGAAASKATEDDDDGSGMGWVKRRREAREKAKKEEEEAAKLRQKEQRASDKAAAAHEATPTVTDNPQTDDPPGVETPESVSQLGEAISRPHSSATIRNPIPEIVIDDAHSSQSTPTLPANLERAAVSPPAPAPATPSPAPVADRPPPVTHDSRRSSADSHREHTTDLAVVPPRPSHHPHPHHPRRSASGSYRHVAVSETPAEVSPQSKDSLVNVAELGETDKKDDSTLRPRSGSPPPLAPAVQRADSSTSSVGSTTSSSTSDPSAEDDEDGDEKEDDDEEGEDEDESEMQRRITAECAGVEKISRHREQRA